MFGQSGYLTILFVSALIMKTRQDDRASAKDTLLKEGADNNDSTTSKRANPTSIIDLDHTDVANDVIFWMFVPMACIIYTVNIGYCIYNLMQKRNEMNTNQGTPRKSPAESKRAGTLYGIPDLDVAGKALEIEHSPRYIASYRERGYSSKPSHNSMTSSDQQTSTEQHTTTKPSLPTTPPETEKNKGKPKDEFAIPAEKESPVMSPTIVRPCKPTDSLYGIPNLPYSPKTAEDTEKQKQKENPKLDQRRGKAEQPKRVGIVGPPDVKPKKKNGSEDSLYGLPSIKDLMLPTIKTKPNK